MEQPDLFSIFFFLAIAACGLLVYLLPVFIAARSNHPHASGIIIVTLFLGWTLIGWVVAMAWAVTMPRRR